MNTTSVGDEMNTIYYNTFRNEPTFVQSVILTSHEMSQNVNMPKLKAAESQLFALTLSITMKENATQEQYEGGFKVILRPKCNFEQNM